MEIEELNNKLGIVLEYTTILQRIDDKINNCLSNNNYFDKQAYIEGLSDSYRSIRLMKERMYSFNYSRIQYSLNFLILARIEKSHFIISKYTKSYNKGVSTAKAVVRAFKNEMKEHNGGP